MMYIPVTIFRLFTSLYILTGPVSSQFSPAVTQQYVVYPKPTGDSVGTGMPSRAPSGQSKFNHPSCEYQPNFRCTSQDICIPIKQVLNGFKDCPDGSDEDARKIDYCKLGPAFHRCDVNSRCLTTPFGFRCECKEGFGGDGITCEKFPMGVQIAVAADLHDSPEDIPVHFNVSVVVITDNNGYNSNLSLTIMGLPKDSRFDVGHPCNLTSWCFTDGDFSFGTYINTNFFPPRDWSGTIPFTLIAEIFREDYWVTGYSATTLEIIAVPDAPFLRVGTVCFENSSVSEVVIPVSARLSDTDGSEELEIDVEDGLPEGFDVFTTPDETGQEEKHQQGASAAADPIVTSLTVKSNGDMRPFNATVVATARETINGRENRTRRTISVQECPPHPKMDIQIDVPNESPEDIPIPLHISVKFELDESPRLISILLLDLPAGAHLNRGHRVNSTDWILSRQDLADDELILQPPRRFSGRLVLTGAIDVLYRGFQYNLTSSTTIQIQPVVNAPSLQVYPDFVCLSINSTNISFAISAALKDQDGSETMIIQYSLPEEWVGSVGDEYHGSYSIVTDKNRDLINITVTSPAGFIYPVEIPVVVMAVEKVTADQKIVFTKIKVLACDASQQAAASKSLQRTTIIWNVTTPIPEILSDGDFAGPVSFQPFHNTSGSLNLSSVYRPISNSSLAITSQIFKNNQSAGKPVSQEESPDSAESVRQTALTAPDHSQDDEIPRTALKFSNATSSSTRTPGKGQRQAKTAKAALRNPKTRSRKTKIPGFPGKAEVDGVELEQIVFVKNVSEDSPLTVNISVVTKNAPRPAAIQVLIAGLPSKSQLDKGRRDNYTGSWILKYADLGPVVITLPHHFGGRLSFDVRTKLALMENKTLTVRENFLVFVRPETDGGHIVLEGPYFEKGCVDPSEKEIHFILKVVLTDDDDSEEFEFLEINGIPKSVYMSPGRFLGSEQSRIIFVKELPNITLRTESTFSRFRIVMNAKIREQDTASQVLVTKDMLITPCGADGTAGERNPRNAASVTWSSATRPYVNVFLCLSLVWTLITANIAQSSSRLNGHKM